jgi:hypothetical protein
MDDENERFTFVSKTKAKEKSNYVEFLDHALGQYLVFLNSNHGIREDNLRCRRAVQNRPGVGTSK